MSVLMANYRVRDFTRFKTVFDEFAPVREEYGVTDHQVLCDPDDLSKVVVVLALPSADAARRFSSEPRRADALARAGVVASSDTILEQVDS
jgi:hypothetical protein